jgi:hypothetical protein
MLGKFMFMYSKKSKIVFVVLTALLAVSCSKKMKNKNVIPGTRKPLTTPILFCANGIEYTTTAFSFLKNELVVRNAVRTGRNCTQPTDISLQDVAFLPNYHVCINEVEFLSAQNMVSYNAGYLYAPNLVATGRACGSIFTDNFEKP